MRNIMGSVFLTGVEREPDDDKSKEHIPSIPSSTHPIRRLGRDHGYDCYSLGGGAEAYGSSSPAAGSSINSPTSSPASADSAGPSGATGPRFMTSSQQATSTASSASIPSS